MKRLLEWRWIDAAAASIVFVLACVDYAASDRPEGPTALNVLCFALGAAAVAIRRRRPLPANFLFVVAASTLGFLATSPQDLVLPFFGLLLFPFDAGARCASPWAWTAPVTMLVVVTAVEATGDQFAVGDMLFPSLFAMAAFLAGRGVHARTRLAAELHEVAVQAEEARGAEAARAVAAERRRIAREMHDIVAHSISVMVVQAGGARRIIDRDAARAEAAAAQIERTGREALVEMRRLLGVLGAGDGGGSREPQPGLEALEALVGRARASGLPVSLSEEGDRRPLPAGLDLTAYRILQEALTNAVKYSGSAPTEVLVRWSDDALELSIRDDGNGAWAADHGLVSGGHGLVGMRERVRLYGGELRTGPRPGGGFEVRARLPLSQEAVPA